MSPATHEVLTEIKAAVAAGQTRIAPALFSACFPRASVSAAFKIAKRDGLIEVAYISMIGTPVYQAAGVKAAMAEKQHDAVHH